ncbi:Uma2 family endonuclease [Rhodococcus coprophilus]|uniref:Uncharacterized protein conserved in cyanobacteria n=1 Tax=Rhodococcus coprophilus TaxID=38310 RepID=A0A2X4X457_9NOCA|nr:Uma2 family endonuclease [Rhodococcus coprophilus]MBM7458176.1 Uma2 family endonuclease [Rhodococcus coprophilus]SQI31264.1 Uncharacterized protein conserved in cyanobacteria [Rhodococcus coprophilus]
MSSPTYPDHLLTLDDWVALPDHEQHHIEVCEGVLIASPPPGSRHDHAEMMLAMQLDDQLPDDLCVLGGVEVLVSDNPLTVRVPDVIVVDRSLVDADPDRAPVGEVRLVVEITVPGTARTDRVTKFSEYAEAGVPQYWIVDLDGPPMMAVFALEDGWYRYDGDRIGTTTLKAVGSDVTLALTDLVPAPVDPVEPSPR